MSETGPYQTRTITVCVCQRCCYEWIPRGEARPAKCPKCFAVDWDIPSPTNSLPYEKPIEQIHARIPACKVPQIKPISLRIKR